MLLKKCYLNAQSTTILKKRQPPGKTWEASSTYEVWWGLLGTLLIVNVNFPENILTALPLTKPWFQSLRLKLSIMAKSET
jgi:hypothetical protein